jgi:hypothetical protein
LSAEIKKGIDDATLVVQAHGGTVNYLQLQTYDHIGGDAANLVRTAISQGAKIIAVPDWVPASEDEAVKAAQAAGIPVMLYNAGGGDKAKELGAINYIGNEEYPAGVAGGTYFATHGAKHVICVNTGPGAGNLEARCKVSYVMPVDFHVPLGWMDRLENPIKLTCEHRELDPTRGQGLTLATLTRATKPRIKAGRFSRMLVDRPRHTRVVDTRRKIDLMKRIFAIGPEPAVCLTSGRVENPLTSLPQG